MPPQSPTRAKTNDYKNSSCSDRMNYWNGAALRAPRIPSPNGSGCLPIASRVLWLSVEIVWVGPAVAGWWRVSTLTYRVPEGQGRDPTGNWGRTTWHPSTPRKPCSDAVGPRCSLPCRDAPSKKASCKLSSPPRLKTHGPQPRCCHTRLPNSELKL